MSIKILIVDDKKENLYALEVLLEENIDGVEVVQTTDGEDALSIAHSDEVDLIILDIQMPNMDGFEVAKYLKMNPRTKDIPIIFLTAVYNEDEFIKKGFDLGAIDYLTKPVNDKRLLNQINLYAKIIANEKKLKVESETRLKQERVIMCQSKMATMGEMMANIAHQWRQPLAAIVNSTDYVKLLDNMGDLEPEVMQKEMDNISEIALFLSSTITTFQNFFRGDKESTKFELSSMLESILTIVSSTLDHHNIKVNKNFSDIKMNGLKDELEQAVLNIVNNAKDVLAEKNIDEKLIFVETFLENKNIVIEIMDNGGGIDKGILSKVFEPYFTTKHKSQGTGIGLYMTYQIIVEHFRGKIIVENREFTHNGVEYKGACFKIVVPKIKVCKSCIDNKSGICQNECKTGKQAVCK
jgi:signal transduction histidine kinase